MAKKKTVYICQSCGNNSPKWMGKCSNCGEWNSYVEEVIITTPNSKKDYVEPMGFDDEQRKPVPVTDIPLDTHSRIVTGIDEFDRILGGGLFPGGVTLIGGEPGIGKSTLLLQVFGRISMTANLKTLYVTGEESPGQIKIRAERLKIFSKELFVVSETNVDNVIEYMEKLHPAAMVVDSIQTLYSPLLMSAPGSVAQLRECSARVLYAAKKMRIPVFLIGHVTKSGIVAGPRVLEHMVDTVLYFEGERAHNFRILRAIKNRFGATNEIGVFEMSEIGLMEVVNPSELFIANRPKNASGSIVSSTMEGSRPILVEIQALTIFNGGFGAPRRSTNGIDPKRLSIILAVLEKRAGIRFFDQDVFVNAAGGIKIEEPAADLAIALAVVSSFKNISIDPAMMVIGEVGLGGEVRTVNNLERRLSEGVRLGFKSCVTAQTKHIPKHIKDKLDIYIVNNLRQALEIVSNGEKPAEREKSKQDDDLPEIRYDE